MLTASLSLLREPRGRPAGLPELSEGRLHIHRVKNGIPSVHPIRGDEMRALRKLRRDYPTDAHVFVSERGGPISPTDRANY